MASTTIVKLPNASSTKVLLYDIRYKNEEEDELIKQPSNGNEMPVHFYKELEGKIKIMSGADNKTFEWIFYKLNDEGNEIIEYKFPTDTGILIKYDPNESFENESFEMVAAFPKHDRQYHYKFSLFQKETGSNEWVGCNCSYQFQTVSVGTITETKEAKNIHFKYRKNIWNPKKRKQDSGSNNNVNKKVKHDNNNNLEDLIEAVSEKEDEAMKLKLDALGSLWEDKSRKDKEFCDWLEAHRKMFLYQNENAVMCSVVEVDGETFPATLRLELGDRKPIHFPPPCSGSQLDRFINNQACWGALYDPSVWMLAQTAKGLYIRQRTMIVEVRPDFYEMKCFAPRLGVDYIFDTILRAQEHMLHYAKAAKWDSEFICKYKNESPKGTPLVCACQKGRVEDVEAMIRGARAAGMDVTAMVSEVGADSGGNTRTPLMAAAWNEHSTIIEILLQCKVSTATTDEDGWNALHYAARNKTTTTIVRLLLNNMKLEDINHKTTEYGNTPLDRCYGYDRSSRIRQELIKLIREKGGKTSE